MITMRRILFSLLVLSALGPVAAHGQSNTAYIDQIGDSNTVSVHQIGSDHHAKTYQDGTSNHILLNQSGLPNSALIRQTGIANTATFDQRGSETLTHTGPNAIINQRGVGHEATVSSTVKLSQPITVTQSGNGAKVAIRTTR
jgi:hypothetical protein